MRLIKIFSFVLAVTLVFTGVPAQAAEPLTAGLQGNTPEISISDAVVSAPEQTPAEPTSEFLEESTTLAALAASDSPFLGVEQGGTVSGVVEIRPNQDQLPGIRKVAYYLNGSKSGKVYQSPFIWGGVNGNGTTGFDTRTIADGDYTLSMVYTDASGDHEILIQFTVNNTNPPPPPTGEEPTPIPASGRTLGGLAFPETTTDFVDIDIAGSLSFLADDKTLYIVDHSNSASPQLRSQVSFDLGIYDILAVPNGVFVLERQLTGETDISGRPRERRLLWHINTSNPAQPVKELKREDISTLYEEPNVARLFLSADGQAVTLIYFEEGENIETRCPIAGGACTGGFYSIYARRDIIHEYSNLSVSTTLGSSALLLTPTAGDYAETITPAPIAWMSGKENYLFVSFENGTGGVYDISLADPNTTGQIPQVEAWDLQGQDPVFNLVFGNTLAVVDSTGLIEFLDISNPTTLGASDFEDVTVTGARRVEFDGTNLYAVTDTEYRIIGPGTSTPPPPSDARVLGVTEGQTVSGTVEIRPNPDALSGIKKVAYYLNGSKSGKVYQAPFIWGGPAGNGTTGFNTATLADGAYTLAMVYTDATGDHEITIHFNVDN
jgi:hypothetical protein